MSDQSVHDLLRSDERIVVIEAPGGCGKTFQGANYALDIAPTLNNGKVLILTHTNAACDVFAESTKGLTGSRTEIRTIDSLVTQIASAYHMALDLPPDPTTWAYANNGFTEIAAKVATLLSNNPMISSTLVRRYPIIVCDEHQDASPDHHTIIMCLHDNGAKLRIFGDCMQSIYESNPKAAQRHRDRWQILLNQSANDELEEPHRWKKHGEGCEKLGTWVMTARQTLLNGGSIDLTGNLPPSIKIIHANNTASHHHGYQVKKQVRQPIDRCFNSHEQILVLASSNGLVQSLRTFWGRRVPIWEGHTRNALAQLVYDLESANNDAKKIGSAVVKFMSAIGSGFSSSSHGNALLKEIDCKCAKPRQKKPGNIQVLAKLILKQPNNVGAALAISQIHNFIDERKPGFTDIRIDMWREFREAQKLAAFDDPVKGFAEITMSRAVTRPKPPQKSLSTVHKAKGLECDNVMLMHSDRSSFGDTIYGRCKLYVALSRAKSTLTIVIPNSNPSPLFSV